MPVDTPENSAAIAEIIRDADQFSAVTIVDGSPRSSPPCELDRQLIDNIPKDLLAAVRFPVAVRPGVSAFEVVAMSEEALKTYADFAGEGGRVVALFLLTTWFSERITTPLTLVLVSQTPAAGSALLLACASLARHSIVITAESAPAIASSAARLNATLIVDATAATNQALRWAAGINVPGVYSRDGQCWAETNGPRIFLASEGLPIPDAIQLPILRGRIAVPPNARQQLDLASDIAGAFAGYRLRNLQRYRDLDSMLVTDPHGLALAERTMQNCVFDDESFNDSLCSIVNSGFSQTSNPVTTSKFSQEYSSRFATTGGKKWQSRKSRTECVR